MEYDHSVELVMFFAVASEVASKQGESCGLRTDRLV